MLPEVPPLPVNMEPSKSAWTVRKTMVCMCLDSNYVGRLLAPFECWPDGCGAEKARENNQAHICMPLNNVEHGWRLDRGKSVD